MQLFHFAVCAVLAGSALAKSECPALPDVQCNPTEIICQLEKDPNGCDMGSFCVPGMVGVCNGFCPVTCKPDEIPCPGPMDPKGCSMPPTCMPAQSGKCTNNCPVHCDASKQQSCSGGMDSEGCPNPDTCLPQMIGTCVQHCPIQCGDQATEMLCPGVMDPLGCKMPDTCTPKMNGKCPGFCPIQYDPKTQRLCDFDQSPEGCTLPPYAVDKTAMCPGVCNQERVCPGKAKYCPAVEPTTGCEMVGQCVEPVKGKDGKDCPNTNCPAQCKANEQPCAAGFDATGCPLPDYCNLNTMPCPAPNM